MPATRRSRRQRKVDEVLREFSRGTLRSSSGRRVTTRRQALAIALSQAEESERRRRNRMARKRRRRNQGPRR